MFEFYAWRYARLLFIECIKVYHLLAFRPSFARTRGLTSLKRTRALERGETKRAAIAPLPSPWLS